MNIQLLRAVGLVAGLALAGPAAASSYMPEQPPTLAEVRTPAGVAEYRAAAAVALVRPERAWTPPCLVVKLAAWLRGPSGNAAEACGRWDRSRRYRFERIETLKGDPAKSFPALLDGSYPVDLDFLRRKRPDLWREVRGLDAKRAGGRHAGFMFLHRGRLADHRVDVANPAADMSEQDGPSERPLLDDSRDYVVFLDADRRIIHWEPVQREGAGRDRLVQRLRQLWKGASDEQIRLTAAPADLFARFSDAAVYEVSPRAVGATRACRPRLAGGGRIASQELALEMFGSELLGPSLPCAPGGPTRRYLVLMAAPHDWRPFGWDQRGAVARLLPIVDGKVRPGDLVSQLRLAPDDPIPVEQALAWVGTGLSDQDRWLGFSEPEQPLRAR